MFLNKLFKCHKKILSFVFCICLLFCSKIFAIGAGVQIGAGPSFLDFSGTPQDEFSNGASHFENITGTLKFFRIPLVIGFGIESGSYDNDFAIGASAFADLWLINLQKDYENWLFYSGVGLSGDILFSVNKNTFGSYGLRIFFGVDWPLMDNFLELYVQATSNIFIIPGNTFQKASDFLLGDVGVRIPVEMGIRFHF
ncbi:MAG: hypothetical protein PUJ82_08670 [Spirochaetales bacterium]|nr:hypothetical protein [Spirochaetales bacterium]MDY5915031.1 hypothetical protein [Treponema sp.]